MKTQTLSTILTCVFTYQATAAFLDFPPEKNKLSPLPQQFEYQLIDNNQFRVGDLLVDAKEMDFSLTGQIFRFRWPTGLVRSGDLVIKDHTGKAVWKTPIKSELVSDDATKKDRELRTQVGSYEYVDEKEELQNQLKKMPYFKFCIQKQESKTKIFLCSKDFYLRGKTNLIGTHESSYKEPLVDINGNSAGKTGTIILNSPSETLYLRAILLSGASVEIDTRTKAVDYMDARENEDGTITFKVKGAVPVADEMTQEDEVYTFKIKKNRPVFFIKGEGDIPLKQEFSVLGKLRPASFQVETRSQPKITYSSELTLDLSYPKDMRLSPGDNKSKVESLTPGEGKWQLLGLTNNRPAKRTAKFTNGQDSWTASYEAVKIPRFDMNVFAGLTPFSYGFQLRGGINSRFYAQAAYMDYGKRSDESKLSAVQLDLGYNLKDAVHNVDNETSVLLGFKNLSFSSASTAAFSLGAHYQTRAPEKVAGFGEWLVLDGSFYVPASGSDLKIKNGFDLKADLKTFTNNTFYYTYGLQHQQYTFDQTVGAASVSANTARTLLTLSAGWIF